MDETYQNGSFWFVFILEEAFKQIKAILITVLATWV